jgi:CSLREA domain-containing protein
MSCVVWRGRGTRWVSLCGVVLAGGLAVPATAAATTIMVTTTADRLKADGKCSLREAVIAANVNVAVDACPAGSRSDRIMLTAAHYRLTLPGRFEDVSRSGDLDLSGRIALSGEGAGSTIIDANGIDQALEVAVPAHVTLSNLTITGGDGGGDVGSGTPGGVVNHGTLRLARVGVVGNIAPAFVGGGVFNEGDLRATDSRIDGNSARGVGGAILNTGLMTLTRTTLDGDNGGGSVVFNRGRLELDSVRMTNFSAAVIGADVENAGSLIIDRSALTGSSATTAAILNGADADARITTSEVSGNTAFIGGIANAGTLTVENSTVAGNHGDRVGGIRNVGQLSLSYVTVAGNDASAASGSGPIGGLETTGQGVTQALGTLIAANLGPAGSAPDCSGPLQSLGFDLIGHRMSCRLSGETSNLVGVDPVLGPLAAHGGPTRTILPQPGSPAIDAIAAGATCPARDQRAKPRPRDGDGNGSALCDIGAVEVRAGQTG